jgi:hypothetical protein
MAFSNRGGSGPSTSSRAVARLVLAPWRQLALLALAVGAAPVAFAVSASVDSSVDQGASCLRTSGEEASIDNGMGVRGPQSLLQVSKPHKARKVMELPQEDSQPKASKGHQAPAAAATVASHDTRQQGRHGTTGHKKTVPSESGASALSFIQTAESVLETVNVVDGGSQEDMPRSLEWPSAVNVVLLVNLVCLVMWALSWMNGGCGRQCLRFGCSSQVAVAKTIELPKPASSSDCNFKESLLPQAGSSFSIPLAHHTEVGSSKVLCFGIPRHPEGPPVSAMVTCQPEGSTLANVQLFEGETGGGIFASSTVPLASCRLVHSTSDVESRNIQGAMMSWLSLLLHEKEGAEADSQAAELATMASDDPERAGPPQQSRVRTCLHGIAEDLIAAGTASTASEGKDSGMRLEVRDSLGALAGTLDFLEPGPASKPGRYALVRQGKTVFDIEAKPDGRSISISRQGEVLALATQFDSRRSPEPELAPEEEEHLQVDIRDGVGRSELALLLTCTIAIIAFKPKDRKECLNVDDARHDVKACALPEVPDHVVMCAPAPATAPVFYQRQPMDKK